MMLICVKVLLRVLMMGDNVKEAIDARRFHHQLMPMQVNHSL
jgi:gamma-glutamyltranspeptidase